MTRRSVSFSRVSLALFSSALFAVALLSVASTAVDAQDAPDPRYLSAVRAELSGMELAPTCEALSATRSRCSFIHTAATDDRTERMVHVVYSDVTDTVYMYVPRLIVAPPEYASTDSILRRMMAINWSMLVSKLEWNSGNGAVRLSSVLHTDSNFDRRAFRGLVRALLADSDRYGRELSRLVDASDENQ